MNGKRNLWIVCCTALLGVLLLATCRSQTPSAIEAPPTWGAMPTRRPTPIPDASPEPVMASATAIHLHNLRVALLAGDMDMAEQMWAMAVKSDPENGEVQREGARLALVAQNLPKAAIHAWLAVSARPYDPEAWIVLGLILQRQEHAKAAHQALEIARTLAPGITQEMFPLRWQTARQAQDGIMLQTLAQQYLIENPGDPLTMYYRAEALLASNEIMTARDFLLLNMKGDEPAAVWYTLARTYLATGAGTEATVCFETARARRADGTLWWVADNPERALEIGLAYAYLRAQRCAEAEPLFRQLTTPYPTFAPLIEAAVICQTPTPTMTPWIISQQTPGP